MNDNKELVEVMLTSYNKYADKIGAPHGYIACMEAALSIIQQELQKRDAVLDKILHRISQWQEDSGILGDIYDDITALKTTTGHDNNAQKRGER